MTRRRVFDTARPLHAAGLSAEEPPVGDIWQRKTLRGRLVSGMGRFPTGLDTKIIQLKASKTKRAHKKTASPVETGCCGSSVELIPST